mmetsp:Transcript_19347/g.74210  ORF Transcript_19347/g.74210 Transcript_19347/m.74210 type:complete len:314 (-) Transcript_19347:441-1382(-)
MRRRHQRRRQASARQGFRRRRRFRPGCPRCGCHRPCCQRRACPRRCGDRGPSRPGGGGGTLAEGRRERSHPRSGQRRRGTRRSAPGGRAGAAAPRCGATTRWWQARQAPPRRPGCGCDEHGLNGSPSQRRRAPTRRPHPPRPPRWNGGVCFQWLRPRRPCGPAPCGGECPWRREPGSRACPTAQGRRRQRDLTRGQQSEQPEGLAATTWQRLQRALRSGPARRGRATTRRRPPGPWGFRCEVGRLRRARPPCRPMRPAMRLRRQGGRSGPPRRCRQCRCHSGGCPGGWAARPVASGRLGLDSAGAACASPRCK